MKHENRLSLFLTDSHGKIIDFQKIEEELGSTLGRKSIQFSYMAPFKVSGKNLKRVLEDKMKEPFTDLIIQLSANDISNLQFLDDQDLKLKMAAKSTRNLVNVVKAAFLQNRNLRNVLILPRSPRRDSTLLNQLSEYANSILKIEVEKSGLEDKIKIGSLSTIQLETERHIVEIFGSRS